MCFELDAKLVHLAATELTRAPDNARSAFVATPKGNQMVFGKRLPVHAKVAQPEHGVCPRCRGTGRIRERGSPIVCKACRGTGKASSAPHLRDGSPTQSRG